MSIGIGINQNVYIKNLELDKDGVLSITFAENTPEAKMTIFDALQSGEVIHGGASKEIKLFSPLAPFEKDSKGNVLTEDKRLQSVQRDLNKTQAQLIHILKAYTTKESYSRIGAESFSGVDVDKENYGTQLVKKEVLLAVHRNRCRVFMEEMQPFVGDDTHLFRLLLVRQSKDKHFATFRGTYIEENPFYEPMEIPEKDSKIKFTPGEIKEGLNDPTPSSRSEAADKPVKEGESKGGPTQSAANIFGQ